MRFYKLEFTTPGDYDAYLVWLLRNPPEFQRFCETTEYFTIVCVPFAAQRVCCAGRIRFIDPDKAEEDDDLVIEALLTIEDDRIFSVNF